MARKNKSSKQQTAQVTRTPALPNLGEPKEVGQIQGTTQEKPLKHRTPGIRG
jgi:hypothetical protein